MTEQQRKITELIKEICYICPRQMFWVLTGNSNAHIRARIMSEITGQKMPKSKSGITVLRESLLDLFEVDRNDCISVVDTRLFVAMGI